MSGIFRTYDEWQTLFSQSAYDEKIMRLYCTDNTEKYRNRFLSCIENLLRISENGSEVALFSAPGRTEIGGNHTDHQHGRVIAGSVNIDMIRAVTLNKTDMLRLKSEGYPLCCADIDSLECDESEKGTTLSLLKGVAKAFADRGAQLKGADIYVTSDVPKGSGLSSSAAFEVLLGVIMNECFMNEKISAVEIAKIGQWAENTYFGKPCGLMDQTASSVGSIITIDFENPDAPVIEKVSADFEKRGCALCIIDSGADHSDLTDEYSAVPCDCRKVAEILGKEYLRETDKSDFMRHIVEIREKCGDRAALRAMHFYSDNERVTKQVNALNNGNFDEFFSLVTESGNSSWMYLQNVIPRGYTENQNVAVAIAAAKTLLCGRGAVRVHGGGFAGTIQAYVPYDILDSFRENIEKILGENSCRVLSIRTTGGTVI